MQPRTTGILFLLALALGAFVYLYEIRGGVSREEAEEASRRFFPALESSDVDELGLRTPDGVEVRVRREGGGWQIVAPVNFPGDEVNLDAMASGIANLTWDSKLEEPEDAAVYGITDDSRWIRFAAGGERGGLILGGATPVGEGLYIARESDLEAIYILPGWRTKAFDHTLLDLRDRRVIHFDRGGVARLRASWPGGSVEIEQRDDSWWLTGPGGLAGMPADESTIDDLLSDLSFLRATGFVDGDVDAADVGLDDPAFSLELKGRTGVDSEDAMHPVSIVFGAGGDASDGDAVARGGVPGVLYRIAASRLADLPRDTFAFRFKELSSFEVADAAAFELIYADADAAGGDASPAPMTIRVERSEEGWAAADGTAWRPGAAARLVAEMAHLEAQEIVAEAMGPDELKALALSPPRAIVRVLGRGQSDGGSDEAAPRLAEISFGYLDPERGIIAKSAGSQVIYRIAASLAEQIPVTHAAFLAGFASVEAAGTPGDE